MVTAGAVPFTFHDQRADEVSGTSKGSCRALAARRRGDAARQAPDAAVAAARSFLREIRPPAGTVFSGYLPIRDELDPRPLMQELIERGHLAALPVVAGRDEPLLFRRWTPGQPLIEDAFGVSIPMQDAEVVRPMLLIVPLLAFDAAGFRLGYGGGYYDRTLAALRAGGGPVTAVGFAYGAQEFDDFPRHAGDQRLDCIVTEREVRRFT